MYIKGYWYFKVIKYNVIYVLNEVIFFNYNDLNENVKCIIFNIF